MNSTHVVAPRKAAETMASVFDVDVLKALLADIAERVPDALTVMYERANGDNNQKCLFVRGLNFSTTVAALRSEFEQYGEITECTINTDGGGNSKGFGFVTFKYAHAAHAAIENPTIQLEGKEVHVNLAVMGKGKAGVRNGSESVAPDGGPNDRKVFVKGLPYETKLATFQALFSGFGNQNEFELVTDKVTGKCKGYGFITFKYPQDASRALAKGPLSVEGRTVQLYYATSSHGKEGPSNSGAPGMGPGAGGHHMFQPHGYGPEAGPGPHGYPNPHGNAPMHPGPYPGSQQTYAAPVSAPAGPGYLPHQQGTVAPPTYQNQYPGYPAPGGYYPPPQGAVHPGYGGPGFPVQGAAPVAHPGAAPMAHPGVAPMAHPGSAQGNVGAFKKARRG